MRRFRLLRTCLLALGLLAPAAAVHAFGGNQCPGSRFGSDLGCTANDVSITNIQISSGGTSCVGGSTATYNLNLTVNFGQPARYATGIFISNNGADPQLVSTGNNCSVAILPASSPFQNLDGDACGDGSGGLSGVLAMNNVPVRCQAASGSGGKLYIPFVVSWDNQVNGACQSIADPVPNTKSKCNAPTVLQGTVNVVVLPAISKTGPASASIGDPISYTVAITNTTGDTLFNAVFKDPAVANFTATGVSCAASGALCPLFSTVSGMQGAGLTIPSIFPGGSVTFTISGSVGNVLGTLSNTATVTTQGQSNSSTANTTVTRAAMPASALADYHFDECTFYSGAGNEILDSSANGYAAAAKNSLKQSLYPFGVMYGYGNFSTYDKYALVSGTGVPLGAAWTVAAWIQWPMATGGGSTLHVLAGLSARGDVIRVDTGNSYRWGVKDAGGSVTGTYRFSSLSSGWHHVAVTASGGTTTLYIDGAQVDSVGRQATTNGNLLYLGTSPDNVGTASAEGWRTPIDELVVFGSALSAAQVGTLYASQLAGTNWDGSARPDPGCMTCATDAFNRTTIGSGWLAKAVSGSFTPITVDPGGGGSSNCGTVDCRLRMTDANGDEATQATFMQYLFPFGNNIVTAEFDYWAYGGTGADGVAVTFSDPTNPANNNPPTAGAFGGSLGYAQKAPTGVSSSDCPSSNGCPGFTGGWAGIGIDEYGNYSNPTEGRVGGTGPAPGAVAIRGSGSGQTGYTFAAGTGTLSGGVSSGNGTTPYRYRITLDSLTDTAKAIVKVERDTTGTGNSYSTLLSYDMKALAGQAPLPSSLQLTYTGSTGGSTNVHEIDNLKVCARQAVAVSALAQFGIGVSSPASTCGTPAGIPSSPVVTVIPKDAAGNALSNYAGTVTLATSTGHGIWRKVGAGSDLVGGSYTFTSADCSGSCSAQFYLTDTYAEDLTITATSGSVSSTSGTVSFRDSVFVITPTTTTQPEGSTSIVVAGRPHQLSVQLYKKDATSGVCGVDTNYTGMRSLDGWYNRDVSDPGGAAPRLCTACNSSWACSGCNSGSLPSAAPASNPTSNNFTNVTFTNGATTIYLSTSDIGKYSLNLRDDTHTFSNVDIGGSTTNGTLTVRPFALYVNNIPGNQKGTATFATAGTSFNADVSAVLATATLDPGNLGSPYTYDVNVKITGLQTALSSWTSLSLASSYSAATTLSVPVPNNLLASGQTPATIPSAGGVILPAGGAGNLSAGTFGSWGSGKSTVTGLSIDNVGNFSLLAAPSVSFLGTTGISVPSVSDAIGRFYVDHFALASGSVTPACGGASGFTYMDQPNLGIAYTIEARNKNEGVTSNYASPAFSVPTPTLVAENNNAGTDLNASTPARISGLGSPAWAAGVYAVNATTATFSRQAAPDGAYDLLAVGVQVVDADGAVLTGRNMKATTNTDCTALSNCDAVQVGAATKVRYGRLRLFNAYGSELLPIQMLARAEYCAAAGGACTSWQVNSLDGCTSLARGNVAVSNPIPIGTTLPTVNSVTAGTGANTGNWTIRLTPAANIKSSFDAALNLGTSTADASCNSGHPNSTAGNLTWLQYAWCAGKTDPNARITFGTAKSRYIYLRERY